MGSERLVNGEKAGENEPSTTPSCIPSKEVLLRLRRNAELRRKYNDLVSKKIMSCILTRLCWMYLRYLNLHVPAVLA